MALRSLAIKKKLLLNEYGLWKGKKQVAGKTEEDLYNALGMNYIPPELREGKEGIEKALLGTLPDLVDYHDMRGDLQMHTTWSDGSVSVEEMANAAYALGYEYIAITDHTKSLTITHGLDATRFKQQWKEIDEVNARFKHAHKKFTVLKGAECDILKDGSLDLDDELLKGFDIVGVSVHSYFNLPEEAQTARIIRAIKNPFVDILFHPTGRIVGKREGYAVDIKKIIETAKETGTLLEIDAFDRLDLRDEHVRMCIEAGVKLAIDSDAHSPDHFQVLRYGVGQARRGWATKRDIINTWELKKMLAILKRNR